MTTWDRARFVVLGVVLASAVNASKLEAADEPIRTFATQKCRYTLPGPGWSWINNAPPNLLFAAGNDKGFVLNLSVMNAGKVERVDEAFAAGFEKSYYQSGQATKRGRRFGTFRGQPYFQTEAKLPDGSTGATRVFISHGLGYTLTLLGGTDPIENDPAFETIMLGFDFTTPPPQPAANPGAANTTAPPTEYEKTLNISEQMGRIAGGCFLAIILLYLIRSVFGKRKT